MSFIAEFASDCENCEVPIKRGDEAKMLNYERKLVAHVTCPAPKPQAKDKVCTDCWLIHAGGCY